MKQSRFVAILLAGVLAVFGAAATAQSYPSRAIRVIIPYAPGGTLDTMARVMAQELSTRVSQPVVIENRPGATGTIGANVTAKAAPDGYTIMMTSASLIPTVLAAKDLPFDFEKELRPILIPFAFPFFIFANNDFPVKSLQDMVAYAKSGKSFTYSTSGIGAPHHIAFELFNQQIKGKLVHVPYKGGAESTAAGVKGEVNIVAAAPVPGLAMAKDGRIRLLGTVGTKRSKTMPDYPSLSELGVEQFDARSWLGYFVPARTPNDIVTTLNRELDRLARSPGVRQRAEAQALEVEDSQSPEGAQKQIADELKAWAEVFRKTNIKPAL